MEFLIGRSHVSTLAAVYSAVDAVVHPFRAEGFGLTVLEAMAAAKPVILTGMGAPMDFVPPDTAYLIPATTRLCGPPCSANGTRIHLLINDEQGNKVQPQLARPCHWAEPDETALARLLRHVYTHQEEARAVGQRAREYVRQHHSWDGTYTTIKQRIAKLRNSPVARLKRTEATN